MSFLFRKGIGIDLGTANTLVFVKGKGIILNEPTVVAFHNHTGQVEAVGNEAKSMIGKAPESLSIIRPMKEGVIADFETTLAMMKHILNEVRRDSFFIFKPNVMICAPSGVTIVEERALIEATKQAGAKNVYLISEPLAAAIGAGLPVWSPTGSLIVDIGGGTTEVAVVSLGGTVITKSIKIAGNAMDQQIIQYIRQEYNVVIGESTAEKIKIELASAKKTRENDRMEVFGRDLVTGLPKTINLRNEEVVIAVEKTVNAIIDLIINTLESAPPELASDIIEKGIVLTGGGSQLKKLDEVIFEKTELPVLIAEDPFNTVAIGTGKALEHLEHFKKTPNVAKKNYIS
ncbi:rod shape-determining protein [Bacillaceae bacterium W0354]